MLAKSCSRSHGQPLPGVRSVAMISIRREISREGVMAHQSLEWRGLYAASRTPIPAKRPEPAAISTDWPHGRGVLWPRHERAIANRDSLGAVLRRTGFRHLPRLGAATLWARRNARLQLWATPRHRACVPRRSDGGYEVLAPRLGCETRQQPHPGDSDPGHDLRHRA